MCTVTWFQNTTGFELFCNRDEHKVRGCEELPREDEQQGTRFLAPRDGEAGGSWIVVNEYGIALSLLNLYQAQSALSAADARSRGLLVLDLAGCRTLDELAERTPATLLEKHRPFTLIGIAVGQPALAIEWNGEEREEFAGVDAPLISSGVDLPGAIRTRADIYHTTAQEADQRAAHLAFHASHEDGPSPRSVCMHRDDAETRSLTHVVVTAKEVVMSHASGSPCCTPFGDSLRLARRTSQSFGN